MSSSPPERTSHVPALDGVRAVAVTLVLLFHLGVPGFGGGFVGVDVFFVLSGFLITSLLLAEMQKTDRISLPAFWLRRARRLLPALVLVLLVVAAAAAFDPSFIERSSLRGDLLSTTGYVANWHFIGTSSYFADNGFPSPAAAHLVARDRGAVLPVVADDPGARRVGHPRDARAEGRDRRDGARRRGRIGRRARAAVDGRPSRARLHGNRLPDLRTPARRRARRRAGDVGVVPPGAAVAARLGRRRGSGCSRGGSPTSRARGGRTSSGVPWRSPWRRC